MADPITDLTSAKDALVAAVNAVTKTDKKSGANDKWFISLEEKAKASGDKEAENKVTTLKFFDEVLRSSIQSTIAKNTDLGRLVSEIRGYQGLTERFFSELRELTVKDQPLENNVVKKRDELFQVLDQVQQWSLANAGEISPSEFGTCTEQFLDRMDVGSKALSFTQQLFKNQQLELAESDLKNVTDAWGNVVSSFVKDAQDTTGASDKLKIGDPATIASFFCIQNRLETLYGLLGNNVSLVN